MTSSVSGASSAKPIQPTPKAATPKAAHAPAPSPAPAKPKSNDSFKSSDPLGLNKSSHKAAAPTPAKSEKTQTPTPTPQKLVATPTGSASKAVANNNAPTPTPAATLGSNTTPQNLTATPAGGSSKAVTNNSAPPPTPTPQATPTQAATSNPFSASNGSLKVAVTPTATPSGDPSGMSGGSTSTGSSPSQTPSQGIETSGTAARPATSPGKTGSLNPEGLSGQTTSALTGGQPTATSNATTPTGGGDENKPTSAGSMTPSNGSPPPSPAPSPTPQAIQQLSKSTDDPPTTTPSNSLGLGVGNTGTSGTSTATPGSMSTPGGSSGGMIGGMAPAQAPNPAPAPAPPKTPPPPAPPFVNEAVDAANNAGLSFHGAGGDQDLNDRGGDLEKAVTAFQADPTNENLKKIEDAQNAYTDRYKYDSGSSSVIKKINAAVTQNLAYFANNVDGINLDTTGMTDTEIRNVSGYILGLSKDADGSKLINAASSDGDITIKYDPSFKDGMGGNYYNNTIRLAQSVLNNDYFTGDGKNPNSVAAMEALGHEFVHAATDNINGDSKLEESIASTLGVEIAGRYYNTNVDPQAMLDYWIGTNTKGQGYENQPYDNHIVQDLSNMGITLPGLKIPPQPGK